MPGDGGLVGSDTRAEKENLAKAAQSSSLDPHLIGDLIVDGPLESLRLLAPHLGIVGKERQIEKSVAAQPSPQSLKALIAAASGVGLEARAFRGTKTALAKTALPAIVHLRHPDEQGKAGFAVLLEHDARGLVLEVGSGGESYVVSHADFEQLWSGIIVVVARTNDAIGEVKDTTFAGRLRQGWRFLLGRGAKHPHTVVARHVAFLLLSLSGVGGGLRAALAGKPLAGAGIVAWVFLCGLGAVLSYELSGRRARLGAGSTAKAGRFDRLCGIARWADCNGVLASKWGAIFGVELASLGLGFFAAALLGLATASVLPAGAQQGAYAFVALSHVATLPAVLFCLGVQVYPLRRFCPLCIGVHIALVAGGCIGAAVVLSLRPLTVAQLLPAALPHAVQFALAFLFVLGVAIPLARLLPELTDQSARLERLGKTRWGALAEFLSRTPHECALPSSPFVLGEKAKGIRLDALVDPFCAPCGPYLHRLDRLVSRLPGLVHVVVHLPSRGSDDGPERELRAAITALGTLAAYGAAKDRGKELLRVAADGGAEAVLAQIRIGVSRQTLTEARAAQKSADALSQAVGLGTPTLVLAGRVWQSSLSDLEFFLTRHPDLLGEEALARASTAQAGQ